MPISGSSSHKLDIKAVVGLYLIYFLFYLGVFFLYRLIKQDWILWDWPALDSYPFLLRLQDTATLPTDYYTNTFTPSSIRSVYVYGIHLIANTLAVHFTYLLKLLSVILQPAFFSAASLGLYLVCRRIYTHHISSVMILGIMTLYIYFQQSLTVAWWTFYPMGTHQWLIALVIILHAWCVLFITSYRHKLVWALLFMAALIHPVMAIMAIPILGGLYWLLTAQCTLRHALRIIIVGLLALGVIALLEWWSDDAVNHIYSIAHAQHYLPSFFEPAIWWPQFMIWQIILLALGIYFFYSKRKVLAYCTALCFGYNLTILGLQYYGVEIWQNDLLTLLGPSRGFVFIGFQYLFFTVILWQESRSKFWKLGYLIMVLLLLGSYLSAGWPPSVYALLYYGKPTLLQLVILLGLFGLPHKKYENFSKYLKKYHFYIPPILICAIVAGIFWMETKMITPIETTAAITISEQGVIQYYQRYIPYDAITIVPHGSLMTYLPILAERGIVIGGGFPFNKAQWPNYIERLYALYGSPTDWQLGTGWIGVKYNVYYNQLSAEQLQQLAQAYQARYVIRTSDAPQLPFPVVYQDSYYLVYQIPHTHD